MHNLQGPEEVAEEIEVALDADDTAAGESGEWYVLSDGACAAEVSYWDES